MATVQPEPHLFALQKKLFFACLKLPCLVKAPENPEPTGRASERGALCSGKKHRKPEFVRLGPKK